MSIGASRLRLLKKLLSGDYFGVSISQNMSATTTRTPIIIRRKYLSFETGSGIVDPLIGSSAAAKTLGQRHGAS